MLQSFIVSLLFGMILFSRSQDICQRQITVDSQLSRNIIVGTNLKGTQPLITMLQIVA